MDTIGPIGFTASDIALLIGAIAGRDELDDYSEYKKISRVAANASQLGESQ